MYNLLVGGAAGQGIETIVAIIEKLLKISGSFVFTSRDFMSRVRGGHNFSMIRFGDKQILGHSNKLNGIVALNEETINLHLEELLPDGFIICDSKVTIEEPRIIKIDMEKMAKEIGNSRVSGTIAVGAILKLFDKGIENAEKVFAEVLDEKYISINLEAIQKGYKSVENKYKVSKGKFKDWMLITGSEALALGAISAGLRFYSAYPMSPSTAIMIYLAKKSEEAGIVVEQAEDEIAAINMAIGASYAGAVAMTGTSGGGFSLMVEALGLSGIAEIPVVIVDVQRPGPATGLPTRTEQSDLKFVISASQGEFPRMVISLRNHDDSFYQTARAFDIAQRYQIPVILLSDQYLGDSSSTVEPYKLEEVKSVIPNDNADFEREYLRYKITEDGISPRLIPGKSKNLIAADSDEHDEQGRITESSEVRIEMVNKRNRKLEKLKLELQEPEYFGGDTFETLLIGWGSTYGAIVEAVQILNKNHDNKYAALVFGDIYPLPLKILLEKVKLAERVINIEQNATGQLAELIREQSSIVCDMSILKYDGRQITADEIVEKIENGVKK